MSTAATATPIMAPYFERVEITPTLASTLLEKNIGNRKPRLANIQKLTRDIVNGKWLDDCMPIRLASDGKVLDGQNRLMAIVEAGIPVSAIIARNVPAEAYTVMDSGRPRTLGDYLGTQGELYPRKLEMVLGLVSFWERGVLGRTHYSELWPTNEERLAVLDKYPEIRDYLTGSNVAKGILTAKLYIFFRFVFDKLDKPLSDYFFESLINGTNLTSDMAVYWLRKRLIENQVNRAKLSIQSIMALIIKAWNAHRKQTAVRSLRFNRGEDFPAIA